MFISLDGIDGAGKTTLIREIAARLGSDDVVTSPTFAIINQYAAAEGRTLYHFDFYRIANRGSRRECRQPRR